MSENWWEPKQGNDKKTNWWETDQHEDAQRLQKPSLAEEIAARPYKQRLAAAQLSAEKFPTSHGPHNTEAQESNQAAVENRYRSELQDYEYTEADPGMGRFDFHIQHQVNNGYKLHLNVASENVREVSDYLKNENFYHKYLKGGEVRDGKTFTVYIGSRKLTEEMAEKISTDLDGLLCRPLVEDEVEFAPNVVGRFNAQGAEFSTYPQAGVRGIVTPEIFSDFNKQIGRAHYTDTETMDAFNKSFDHLTAKFGAYFYAA